jgi:cobalt-zinc-cadmium efflux system membrane fusion protein
MGGDHAGAAGGLRSGPGRAYGFSRFAAGAVVLLGVLGGGACRGRAAEPAKTDEPHADVKAPGRIRVSPEVMKDAGVEVAPVTKGVLAPTLSVPGEIVAIPDRSARLSTPVSGRIDRVLFNEGSVIKKGEPLAVIRVPDLGKVRGAYASTTARAKAARLAAERLTRLRAEGLAGEQEVLDSRAQADALDADAKALGEQLAALGVAKTGGTSFELILPAPVSGLVTKRDVVVGQPVATDQTLAEVIDLREVWFLARIYEKDLGRLGIRAEAEVSLNAYPLEPFAGTVTFIGAQVEPASRTVIARIQLVNKSDRLRLGLFGTAKIAAADDAPRLPTIIIPRSALTELDSKPNVFVQLATGEFEVRPVVLGESAPGKVGVVEGLKDGEVVATKGVLSLKSIALRSSLAEDP